MSKTQKKAMEKKRMIKIDDKRMQNIDSKKGWKKG